MRRAEWRWPPWPVLSPSDTCPSCHLRWVWGHPPSAGGWSLRAGCPSAWSGLACLCHLGGFGRLSRVPRPLAKVRDHVAQKELGTDGLPPLPRDSGLCHQAGRLPSSPITGSPSDRHLISRISVNNTNQLELQRGSSLRRSAQLPSQLVLPRHSRQDCV